MVGHGVRVAVELVDDLLACNSRHMTSTIREVEDDVVVVQGRSSIASGAVVANIVAGRSEAKACRVDPVGIVDTAIEAASADAEEALIPR